MPSRYIRALNSYSALMEEAKYRLLTIDTALEWSTGLPDGAVREYCFLQLRMLCELIALGCLTAHGDLQSGKLKGRYEANKIIRGLQRLHPKFYPVAATLTETGTRTAIELLEDGFFTKEELMKLYWKCGKVLHRGSFKALPSRRYSDTDIEEIETSKKKIEVLLSCHTIIMADNRTWVVFRLRNEEGNVEWRTME
jgi:hypothetical protein